MLPAPAPQKFDNFVRGSRQGGSLAILQCMNETEATCPECVGSGEDGGVTCPRCNGSGHDTEICSCGDCTRARAAVG
jgi:hypothetical protein